MKDHLIYTDLHLAEDNWKLCREQIIESFEVCKAKSIDTIAFLGDFLDSRSSIHFNVFQTLLLLGELAKKYGITVYCVDGNHDKQSYTSEDSWMDVFDSTPWVRVVKTTEYIEDLDAVLLSYFDEHSEVLQTHLNKAIALGKKHKGCRLYTHLAISGVRNNDGTHQENGITPSMLDKVFKQTFVGHYHDVSKLGKSIHYIGATRQNNFGEDPDKGYIIVDSETGEWSRTKFKAPPPYESISIDLTDHKDSESVLKAFQKAKSKLPDNARVRLVADGPEELGSYIPKEQLKGTGVKIKHKKSEVTVNTQYLDIDVDSYEVMTNELVLAEWDKYKASLEGVSEEVIDNVSYKLKNE